jgi:hypothetical protein
MSAWQNPKRSAEDMGSEGQFMTFRIPKTSVIAATVILGLTIFNGGHTAFAQSDMALKSNNAVSQTATAIADIAWSFADGMGGTLTETAAGTWQSIDSYSDFLKQSVTKTWDENIAPTLPKTAQTIAFTSDDTKNRVSSPSVTDALGDGWRYIKDLFDRSAEEVATPTNSSDWLEQLNDEHQTGFWTLLGDAGYKLKEIDTTIGLIPAVKFKYAYGRELSEADKAWLERKLDVLAYHETGPVAALRRAIIHGILEGNETDGFFIETVKISLLPLPQAEFSLSPTDAPMPEALDKIYRAVIGKQQRAHSN